MFDLTQDTLITEQDKKEKPYQSLDKKKVIINQDLLEEQGFVTLKSSDQRNAVNEEFRAIKHEIISNAFDPVNQDFNHKNLVMLTSALANEGKTFCAINLALMLSLEKDKSVLLVDADVLKPSVYKTLKIGNKPGLIDYLLSENGTVEDYIYETSIANLSILPAGKISSLSYELLASDKMVNLTEKLASLYKEGIVLFDGPPILGVIEAISLSRLVEQVIIVCEHNKTNLANLKEVTTLLDQNLFTGLIINKSTNNKLGKYGYGYGYGYGANES